MAGFEYTISQGVSVAGLARCYRIEGGWRAIWDDEHNEELRRLRGVIEGFLPGDRIFRLSNFFSVNSLHNRQLSFHVEVNFSRLPFLADLR